MSLRTAWQDRGTALSAVLLVFAILLTVLCSPAKPAQAAETGASVSVALSVQLDIDPCSDDVDGRHVAHCSAHCPHAPAQTGGSVPAATSLEKSRVWEPISPQDLTSRSPPVQTRPPRA